MRVLSLLPAVLFPVVAAAAVADLDVRVVAPKRVGAGARVAWTTIVRNNGPDTVPVNITSSDSPFFTSTCSFGQTLAPGEETAVRCVTEAPKEPGTAKLWLSGNARSLTSTDPDPANNGKVELVDVVLAPDITLSLDGPLVARRNAQVFYFVNLPYTAVVPAPPSVVVVDLDPRLRLIAAPPSCLHDTVRARLSCSMPALPPGASSIRIETRAPAEGTGAPLVTRVQLRSDDPTEVAENGSSSEALTHTFRTFFVTNTDDSGPGSLRAAIEGANEAAGGSNPPDGTEIAFAIDRSPARWHTIRPRAPLPPLVATNVLFDGTSQRELRGDTNPEGPDIEISGTDLGEGDGLVIAARCGSTIRAIAINGFPGAGLALRPPQRVCAGPFISGNEVSENFLGTDATGANAIPNERGLVIETGGSWSIHGNVISGNRRSGIFLSVGSNSRITNNRVGFRAHRDLPLGNGGSGIFIGPGAWGTDLDNNYVTYNRENGIAVAAEHVRIGFNSIHANGLIGIDVGLDGPGGGITDPPRITSAIYDPQLKHTIVEGVGTRVGSFGSDEVHVYANDACDRTGRGEGQYTLGRASFLDFRTTSFRFLYPGDLTGKFISGTSTVRTCMGCFLGASSVESSGTEFNVFTRTTEFAQCVEVKASSGSPAPVP